MNVDAKANLTLPQYKLSFTAQDFDAARSASGILGEMAAPLALAVTSFEAPPSGYVVQGYYEQTPDLVQIATALAEVPGQRLGDLAIEIVPAMPPARLGHHA